MQDTSKIAKAMLATAEDDREFERLFALWVEDNNVDPDSVEIFREICSDWFNTGIKRGVSWCTAQQKAKV